MEAFSPTQGIPALLLREATMSPNNTASTLSCPGLNFEVQQLNHCLRQSITRFLGCWIHNKSPIRFKVSSV